MGETAISIPMTSLSDRECHTCGRAIERFLKTLDFFFLDGTTKQFGIKNNLGPCMYCGERGALMFLVNTMLPSMKGMPKSLIVTYDNMERHCLWVN